MNLPFIGDRPAAANPRLVFIASSVLSLALLYMGWSWLVSSQSVTLDEKRQTFSQAAAENKVNRKVEAEEPALRAEVSRAAHAFCDVAPLVTNASDVSQVLSEVQRAAHVYNVQLTGMRGVADAVQSPQFNKLQQREYPATVTGTYPNVRQFFQAIARMNRIVVIPEFRMVGVSPRVSTGFTLVAYNTPPKVPALPAGYEALQCVAASSPAPPVIPSSLSSTTHSSAAAVGVVNSAAHH